jgi:hypothetical protein
MPKHKMRSGGGSSRRSAPENDVAFYVGNQAKRPQTFSILGLYYPKKST